MRDQRGQALDLRIARGSDAFMMQASHRVKESTRRGFFQRWSSFWNAEPPPPSFELAESATPSRGRLRHQRAGFRQRFDSRREGRADPADLKAAHALQDAIKVQQARAGSFEVPVWDTASQSKVRAAAKSGAKRPASSASSAG